MGGIDQHADLELTPIFAAMCEQFRWHNSLTDGDSGAGSCHGFLDLEAKDEQVDGD